MVEGGGFEPPKASPTDLQSVPFGHSGTPPQDRTGHSPEHEASGGIRTPDPLITNQLLYHLSYAGKARKRKIYICNTFFSKNQHQKAK